MKRIFDTAAAGFGIIVTAPAMLLIGMLIKVTDRGPIFFRQTRIGQNGRPFGMWKFRTMVVNAEQLGAQITADGDPRITRFGHWLRQTKMDELPQLFNVVTGDMSLVGPRPEVPVYVNQYTADQRKVLALQPGITDPASIQFIDEGRVLATSSTPERLYVEQIMPEKIRLNLEYAGRASVLTDFGVLLRTVSRLLS